MHAQANYHMYVELSVWTAGHSPLPLGRAELTLRTTIRGSDPKRMRGWDPAWFQGPALPLLPRIPAPAQRCHRKEGCCHKVTVQVYPRCLHSCRHSLVRIHVFILYNRSERKEAATSWCLPLSFPAVQLKHMQHCYRQLLRPCVPRGGVSPQRAKGNLLY